MNLIRKYQAKTIYFIALAFGITIPLVLHYLTDNDVFEMVLPSLIIYCLVRAIYCFYKSKSIEREEK